MKKRALALVLAGAMVFGLTACSSNKKSEETTSSVQEETNTTEATPVVQLTEAADYSQYVTLGAYTGLDIAVDAAVVSDADIQDYKDNCVKYYNAYFVPAEQITTGTTKDGDVINLDYSGMLNGEAFAGGTAAGQQYTVGSGRFISDLDKQLAGLEVGKEYELPCTFPEDYTNADLAGKEVIFVVTVNYIEGDKDEYEWGDEFAAAYTSGEYTTAAALEEYIKNLLIESAKKNQQQEYEMALWDAIISNCTISSYPEEKIAASAEDYYQDFVDYAAMYGTDLESFLSANYSMTPEQLQTDCNEMAKQETTYFMVACEIYKKLGKTLSDEEYNQMAQETAAQYGFKSAGEFIAEYGEDYVRECFIFSIVSDYVFANNTMSINE